MKRIQKFAAVNVIAALIGAGVPAMAAQSGYDDHTRGGMQHQSADRRDNRQWNNNNQDRNFRGDDRDRRNYDRSNYDRRDYGRGYREDRGDGYGPVPEPVYQPAPVYGRPVYNNGYYYDHSHNGRTAAIIGGTAAAGALIGAAAGHGQGAAIGAVIGGVAGVAISASANHHDRH